MKSNLTKKKVRVRGKGGKTYMRSMSVRTQSGNDHLHKRMAKLGFIQGIGGGIGAYAGHHIAARHGKDRAVGMAIGSFAGGVATGTAYMHARDKKLEGDVRRARTGRQATALGVGSLANFAGHAVGAALAHGAKSAAVRFRQTH